MNRLYHVRSLVKRSISVGCHNRCSSSPKCDFSVEYFPRGSWVRGYSSRAKNVPLTDKQQDSLSGVLSQVRSRKPKYDYLSLLRQKKKEKPCFIELLCIPPIRIYKGYMSKNPSPKLKKSIKASDLRKGFFKEPNSCDAKVSAEKITKSGEKRKGSYVASKLFNVYNRSLTWLEKYPSASILVAPLKKLPKPKPKPTPELVKKKTCFIEFSGSSKANPGLAGAGAVLKTQNGRVICKLRQGLGVATNNVAQYHGLILGLKYAISKGYNRIGVMGNSLLVCNQVKGEWKVKNMELLELHKEVEELIMSNKCITFKICYQSREFISDAHAQADLGTRLCEGQVKKVRGKRETEIRL